MTALPMRPLENALAILGAFFIAGALLPWPLRLACALAAIAVVLVLAVFRLRAHRVNVSKKRTTDVYNRIHEIRAARKGRFRQPPRR